MGASMVKWTKTMIQYTKIIMFFCRRPKSSSKCCLDWMFFHDNLHLCVKYSNIKLRSSILIIKSDTQKQVIEYSFERRFHDRNYFEVGFFDDFFSHIP